MSKLVINACTDVPQLPVTQFTNYDFAALTVFGNSLIGANSTGLYAMGGDLDDASPIVAWFEINKTDLGVLNQKRLRSLIVNGKFGSDAIIIAVAFDDETLVEYDVKTLAGMKQSTFKRWIDRAQMGTSVKVKVANVAGADFDVDTIEGYFILRHTLGNGMHKC